VASVENSKLDSLWRISLRWAQYRGEFQLGLLKLACLFVCYCAHLWAYTSTNDAAASAYSLSKSGLHWQVTTVFFVWFSASALVIIALHRPWFPGWLPAAIAAVDGLLFSSILYCADSVMSVWIGGYFLLIGAALFRLSTVVLWISTTISLIGFWTLLGLAHLPQTLNVADLVWVGPTFTQTCIMLAMLFVAILTHRGVKQTKSFAMAHAKRTLSL
jgi:hypothetical protein